MKLKEQIKTTAVLSMLSALTTVLLVIGGFFDVLDLVCASVASLLIHIICREYSNNKASLVFGVSALLSNLFLPLRSCPIIFTAFFGYFPILRNFLRKKVKVKKLVNLVLIIFYNIVMILLYNLFKEVWGLANEPPIMYIALFVAVNIFYISFELLLSRIMILYNYYIKKILRTARGFNNGF